jgi:type II secretion system protein C
MNKAQKSKKIGGKIPPASEERILVLSLENLDFGARRLVPLLQQENIIVSASTIYNILKRHDQQNREKRLAKIEGKSTTQEAISKKLSATITDEVAERVVKISLQNPEYGARRLLLLLKEKEILLSESAVYNILKRNGLQNRTKRLLRIEEQQAVSITLPVMETDQSSEVVEKEISPPAVAPEPVSEETGSISAPSRVSPVLKAPARSRVRRSLLLTLLNIFLLALLVFFGFHTWQKIRNALLEPEAIAAITSPPVNAIPQPEAAIRPLNDYRIIWERNLFNVSNETPTLSKTKIAPEKIIPADKDLGLKLVGTVMADDPALRFAIVHDLKNRGQKHFNEGQTIGDIQVKQVLRHKVIIATADGDRLLTLNFEETSGKAVLQRQPLSISQASLSERTGKVSRYSKSRMIELEREVVEDALADTQQLLQELNITPYKFANTPRGFRIGEIPPDNILAKMGLRNREVIVGINDESIRDVDQAAEFLNTLADGGEVTIKVRRRARTRKIRLNIF